MTIQKKKRRVSVLDVVQEHQRSGMFVPDSILEWIKEDECLTKKGSRTW